MHRHRRGTRGQNTYPFTTKTSEIIIQFRRPPHNMFPMEPGSSIRPNYLPLFIQPDEGMHLRFEAKVP